MVQRSTVFFLTLIFASLYTFAQTQSPSVISPQSNQMFNDRYVPFQWSEVPGATYEILISYDFSGANVVYNQEVSTTSTSVLVPEEIRSYHWRVRAKVAEVFSEWTSAQPFVVTTALPQVPLLILPENSAHDVPVTARVRWVSEPTTSYLLQVSTTANFSSVAVQMNVPTNGANTEVLLAGLNYSTTYFWRVRGSGPGGASQWSDVRSFSTITREISTPTLVTPPNNARLAFSSTLPLAWNSDESAYEVQIASDAAFTQVIALSQTTTPSSAFTLVRDNSQYFWRVRSVDGNRTSEWSSTNSFTVGDPNYIPVPVAPILASPLHLATGVRTATTLTWNTVLNADTYEVEVSPNENFFTVIYKAGSIIEAKAHIENLSPGMTYYWRVRSQSDVGVSAWARSNSFTTGNAPLSPMLSYPLSEEFNVQQNVNITWASVASATGYDIQVSTSSKFEDLLIDEKGLTATTFTAQLPEGKLLFWRVRASNEFGAGTWSSWRYFRTAGAVTSVDEETTGIALANVSAMPNPTAGFMKIGYTVPANGHVTLSIIDMMGRTISTLVDFKHTVGSYEVPFDGNRLEQGVYIYHLNYNGYIQTGKVTIVR